jgi:hypothetical protein
MTKWLFFTFVKQKIALLWALSVFFLFLCVNNQHLRVKIFQNEKEAQIQGYLKNNFNIDNNKISYH